MYERSRHCDVPPFPLRAAVFPRVLDTFSPINMRLLSESGRPLRLWPAGRYPLHKVSFLCAPRVCEMLHPPCAPLGVRTAEHVGVRTVCTRAGGSVSRRKPPRLAPRASESRLMLKRLSHGGGLGRSDCRSLLTLKCAALRRDSERLRARDGVVSTFIERLNGLKCGSRSRWRSLLGALRDVNRSKCRTSRRG